MNRTEVLNRASSMFAAASRDAERIGKALWKVLSMSAADDAYWPAGYLCAVVAEGGLDVLSATRSMGRTRLRGRRFYALEERNIHPAQALAADLKLAMTDLKAAGAEVILVVPGSWVITRKAELPQTVGEHLSKVVGYELDRLTPLAADEAYYDYGIIGQDAEKIRLAVAAMRIDRIHPYLDALKERGIEVRKVVSELDALGSLCRAAYRTESCVFVKPTEEGYEGGLLENGVLSLTFSGAFLSKDLQRKAQDLTTEIRGLLDRHLPGGDPLWIIAARTEEAGKALAERMGRPVKIIQTDILRDRMGETPKGTSLAALGGIVATVAPEARGMNLLERGVHTAKKVPLALTAVLVLALMAAGLFLLVSPLQLEERRIAEIERQLDLYKEDVRKADAIKREVEAIETDIASIYRFKEQRPVYLEILREMTAIMPKNTWLSRARITDDSMDIEGYSATATEILPLLEASPYFKKVEFASPTFRDARLNSDRFTIRMELEGFKRDGLEPNKKQ
jgi:general secretion pathway protein L